MREKSRGQGRGIIRLLVVDDNARFRHAFDALLELWPDIEVVAQAGSLSEARENLSGVDVAIIDGELPEPNGDGLRFIGELREARPATRVLVMSTTMERTHWQKALEEGADGVIDKIAPPDHTVAQIRAVWDRWPTFIHRSTWK